MSKTLTKNKIKSIFDNWIFPEIGDTVKYKKANVRRWLKVNRNVCGLYCHKGSNVNGEFKREYENATFDTISKFGDLNEEKIMWWTSDKYTRLILTEKTLQFRDENEN